MATDTEGYRPSSADTAPFSSPTHFRAPSRGLSRQQSHRRDASLALSSSPPGRPSLDFRPDPTDRGTTVDPVTDEKISPLDPRRFTPTLHASLVSEILGLRRELESKNKAIEVLEVTLDETRTENESINDRLAEHAKENRSLKRQMQLLEGGTLSAVSEITKERDEAVENIGDVRKRLEQAQKRIRTYEEDAERSQMLFDRERLAWESERRTWERKVHIVENRLKVVLNEVVATQIPATMSQINEAEEDVSRDANDTSAARTNSALGWRRASVTSVSTHDGEPATGRFSSLSFANGNALKSDGLNLADELALEEDIEEEGYEPPGDSDVDEELPEERPMSVQSQWSFASGAKARKVLGLTLDQSLEKGSTAEMADRLQTLSPKSPKASEHLPPFVRPEYREIGVQYSPPQSPQLLPETVVNDRDVSEVSFADKATATVQTADLYHESKDMGTETVPVEMVSSSCQTISELPSPPTTPKEDVNFEKVPMVSTSTQTDHGTFATDEVLSDSDGESDGGYQPPVPVITIHPPGSEPPTPRSSVVLPPHTKSISCQTDNIPIAEVRSIAMQTEEIRVDKRPVKIPASLLPSAIIDYVTKSDDPNLPTIMGPPPPRSPLRAPTRRDLRAGAETKGKQPDRIQAYPGNNDNGPLADDPTSEIRRPFRSSSLFAGFENLSDEDLPTRPSDTLSDDEYFSRSDYSHTFRSGKPFSRHQLDNDPLQEIDEVRSDSELGTDDFNANSESASTTQNQAKDGRKSARNSRNMSSSRPTDIRRTALISSGAAAHQKMRPRSPSDPSISSSGSVAQRRPPFPVPARHSSRNIPGTGSDGRRSPTPGSNGPTRTGRRVARQPTLRKARSAAATVPQNHETDRQRSRSPPALSTSSFASESPQLPRLPFEEVVVPRSKRYTNAASPRPSSPSVQSHTREESESVSGGTQPTSVVDAIAQTMVGEWMFKYVRRRKSFGVGDSNKDTWELGKSTDETSANITNTGIRHKRWVWLAPYERAVMWSSKQPTSGTALLGKSGRKLTIQSVLDVKDDTPFPKGTSPQPQFNRSILILTPQRALKFTAMSLDRHYVWLSALSFLSHSSVGVNNLPSIPPVPTEEYIPPPPSGATLRRNPIRDSIRVAKGKPRPRPGARSFTAHPAVPEVSNHLDLPEEPEGESAADPPNVPRFSNHGRKRSNTAPRPPAAGVRTYSSNATMPSVSSAATAASFEYYNQSYAGAGYGSGQNSFSRRTSEASGPSSVGTSNFFEAVGTVRMEAFVDRMEASRQKGLIRRQHAVKQSHSSHGSTWGSSPRELDFARSEDGSDIYYRHEDPFRGF